MAARCALIVSVFGVLLALGSTDSCVDIVTECITDVQLCCCDSGGLVCVCCDTASEVCAVGRAACEVPGSASSTLTRAPSASATRAPSTSTTRTPSTSATPTSAATASLSQGASPSETPTVSASASVTATATPSPSASDSPSASAAPSTTPPPSASAAPACSAGSVPLELELVGCAADGTPVFAPSAVVVQRVVPVVAPLIVNGSLELGPLSSTNFYAQNASVLVLGTLVLGGRVALRVDEPPAPGAQVVWQLFESSGQLSTRLNYSLQVVPTYVEAACTRLAHRERRTERSLAVVLTSEQRDDGECAPSSSSARQPVWQIVVPVVCGAGALCLVVACVGALLYASHRGWCWSWRNYVRPEDEAIARQMRASMRNSHVPEDGGQQKSDAL